MLNSNSIGNKIASARKKANLSQAELAQQVSISSQAVGKWERGESLPDITTLNRLADLLGVDLNYFSENVSPAETVVERPGNTFNLPLEENVEPKKMPGWDMSRLNLADSDFSGLKNLHEKLSSANIQRCLFVGSELSGLQLSSNNIDSCDFSGSDMSRSRIQSSNLDNTKFKNCCLQEAEFYKDNINKCDFSNADLTKVTIRMSNFSKNTIEHAKLHGTSFLEMQLRDIVFEGMLEDCRFEHCSFNGVKFQNATLKNTFFKNNDRLKKVQFINCKADKMTYAFLKNNLADVSGIIVL